MATVTVVAIKVHYLCRSECGDLRGVAAFVVAVTSVPIKIHYLCRSEGGDQ